MQVKSSKEKAAEFVQGDTDPIQRLGISELLRGMQQSIERRLDLIDCRLERLEVQTNDSETASARRHQVVEQQIRKIAHAMGISDDVIAAGDDEEDRKRLKVWRRARWRRAGGVRATSFIATSH